MVHLDTILESLVIACRQSDLLPESITYSTITLDGDGEHSDIRPPVIEFSVDRIDRDTSRNTEKVGVEYDDSGTPIGYIYKPWFDGVVEAEVLSVANTQYNHRELEQRLQQSLYKYDKFGLNDQLPDPENINEPLRNVSWVKYRSTVPNSDFSTSPSVRTRKSALDIGFTHEISTADMGVTYETVDEVTIDTDVVFSNDGSSETESSVVV